MAKSATPKKVLVVDDHPLVRRGFRQLLNDEPGLVACWEAETATEALDLAVEHHPDLVLMDVILNGGASGINLTRQLCELDPAPHVLVVSIRDEVLYAHRALAAGAKGYIMKRASDDELVRAVRRVLGGRIYVSDAIRERLFASGQEDATEMETPVDQLSNRELEIFLLLGQGYEPRHIADQLHVSVKTVNTHRRNLKQKLNLASADELRRYAIAWHKEQNA